MHYIEGMGERTQEHTQARAQAKPHRKNRSIAYVNGGILFQLAPYKQITLNGSHVEVSSLKFCAET